MTRFRKHLFGIHGMVPELRQLTNVGLALGAQNSSSDGDVDSDVTAEDAAPLDSAAAPMTALADGVVNDGAAGPPLGVGLAEQLGESEEVGLVQTHVAGVPSSSSGGGGVPGPLVEGPASAASVLPPGPSSVPLDDDDGVVVADNLLPRASHQSLLDDVDDTLHP